MGGPALRRRQRHATLVFVAGILMLSYVVAAEQTSSPPESVRDSSANPGYVVILVDGTVIPSKSKPLAAFGSFRFVDVTGRTRVLGTSGVDLEATRKANADVPHDPSRGTFSIVGGPSNDPQPLVEEKQETSDEPPAQKSVTVYSATWCGYCKDLKRFLAANKIPATIIEVDQLPNNQQNTARSKMKGLTGRVAFPTVIIDGEAKAGFSKSWMQSKLGR